MFFESGKIVRPLKMRLLKRTILFGVIKMEKNLVL